eukprot:scaffold43217_cov44-Phaeocystis_antarctica.AAC.1
MSRGAAPIALRPWDAVALAAVVLAPPARRAWGCTHVSLAARFTARRHPGQPQALPERPDRQAGDCQAQVGHGVQGVLGLGRRVHEPAAGEHRGVGGWHLLRQPRRGAHPMQQCLVSAWRARGG